MEQLRISEDVTKMIIKAAGEHRYMTVLKSGKINPLNLLTKNTAHGRFTTFFPFQFQFEISFILNDICLFLWQMIPKLLVYGSQNGTRFMNTLPMAFT